MTCSGPEGHISHAARVSSALSSASFQPDVGERDEVLLYLEELVGSGFASWWINEAGGTELHLANGQAFLLQDEGIVCLR